MPTAEQVKALIRSHVEEDDVRFQTLALQIAAHEARQGHTSLAHDLKLIIDRGKSKNRDAIVRFPDELNGLILSRESDDRISTIILSESQKSRIERILLEYHNKGALKQHGLTHRRKVLLSGPPGTGKTLTASVIAGELGLPLRTIQVDRLVTKFMGETAAKLRQIFDVIKESQGVYLFDEFDAIGGDRGRENDVGEMRRVLNSFLQFIELDTSDNIIVAATNNAHLLDRALFRRFDDALYYELPDRSERKRLIKNVLAGFVGARFGIETVVRASDRLSQAEIVLACRDSIKGAILSNRKSVDGKTLKKYLEERQSAY